MLILTAARRPMAGLGPVQMARTWASTTGPPARSPPQLLPLNAGLRSLQVVVAPDPSAMAS